MTTMTKEMIPTIATFASNEAHRFAVLAETYAEMGEIGAAQQAAEDAARCSRTILELIKTYDTGGEIDDEYTLALTSVVRAFTAVREAAKVG